MLLAGRGNTTITAMTHVAIQEVAIRKVYKFPMPATGPHREEGELLCCLRVLLCPKLSVPAGSLGRQGS